MCCKKETKGGWTGFGCITEKKAICYFGGFQYSILEILNCVKDLNRKTKYTFKDTHKRPGVNANKENQKKNGICGKERKKRS